MIHGTHHGAGTSSLKRKHLVGPLERWNGHRQVHGARQAQGWYPAAVESLGKLSGTSVLYLLKCKHRGCWD